VINAQSHTVIDQIDVGAGKNPISIAVSPDNNLIYVANFTEATVAVYNTTSLSLLAEIPTGQSTYSVALSKDGQLAYASAAYDRVSSR
jgi:YVTN family beta-propeller protein